MKQAVLIALGDELLSGVRREGNCGWLASRLALAGWQVLRMEIIPDDLAVLEETLSLWVGRAHLVILSGGLGPTHDDCTRNALAYFLKKRLVVDHEAYNKILSRYPTEMKENLEICRLTQGSVPEGTRALDNPMGSALGISFTQKGSRVYAFPGVPAEFRAMAEQELAEDMLACDRRMRSVVVSGWPESLLKDRLAPITDNSSIKVSILPSSGVIELILRGEPDNIEHAEEKVRELLPGDCLPQGCLSLAEAIILEAKERMITVACAESCTGGLVGAALTEIAGSSAVFLGSAVCYSNEAKMNILSVPKEVLDSHGAVSSECARAMARGALSRFDSDFALSITGIAGPEGGSEEKPVGTVWFGIAGPREESAFRFHFPGDRRQVRLRAMNKALHLLRKSVLEAR